MQSLPKPRPPPDTLLVNDLIRDYLSFTGYKHALAAFNADTGFVEDQYEHAAAVRDNGGGVASVSRSAHSENVTGLPRRFLAEEVDVPDTPTSRSVPLLYSMVSTARAARLSRSAALEFPVREPLHTHFAGSDSRAFLRASGVGSSGLHHSYGEDTFASDSSLPGLTQPLYAGLTEQSSGAATGASSSFVNARNVAAGGGSAGGITAAPHGTSFGSSGTAAWRPGSHSVTHAGTTGHVGAGVHDSSQGQSITFSRTPAPAPRSGFAVLEPSQPMGLFGTAGIGSGPIVVMGSGEA